MGVAGAVSWKRDLVGAALLTAAMLGAPAAAWAGAKYHTHARAIYYAWKWAREQGESYWLANKLERIKAPAHSRLAAYRAAYKLARGKPKEKIALELLLCEGGPRALYALVMTEAACSPPGIVLVAGEYSSRCDTPGICSPGEELLARALVEALKDQWWRHEPFDVLGAPRDESPPALLPCGYEFWDEPVRKPTTSWTFGSYRATRYRRWISLTEEGSRRAPHYWWAFPLGRYEIERLPGPWRALPPAPPPQKGCEDKRAGL